MAFTFVKKIGAPAGTLKIGVGSQSFVIDDSANPTITVPDAKTAADLSRSPYLTFQGGAPDVYQPPTGSDSRELAYVERTDDLSSQSQTSAAPLDYLLPLAFTVAKKPVYVEVFIPCVQVGNATTTFNGRLAKTADGSVVQLQTQFAPFVAFAFSPYSARWRFIVPGNYSLKFQTYVSGTSASYAIKAASVGGRSFLRAYEV